MNLPGCGLKEGLISDRLSVLCEEGQLFEIDDIVAVLGIALCEDRHSAADDAAGFFDKGFDSAERIASGNYIVDNEDFLAFHLSGMGSVEIEGLGICCCDGVYLIGDDIAHIELDRLACEEICRVAMLAGHFMSKRNTLGFSCDDVIILRCALEKLGSAGCCQFAVSENDECSDLEFVCQRAKGKLAVEAGDIHFVVHSFMLLIFSCAEITLHIYPISNGLFCKVTVWERGENMKKIMVAVLLAYLFTLTACFNISEEIGQDTENEVKVPETMVIPNNIDAAPQNEPEGEEVKENPKIKGVEVTSEGGRFVMTGGAAVFTVPDGGIAMANIGGEQYHIISEASPERVFFDGTKIFYFNDEGIFSLSSDGETFCLTDDRTYQMWLDNERIYYVKQKNLAERVGELWAIDKDGSNAVVILPEKIKGSFCVGNGWVYFTSEKSGAICRSMLYGSASETLVQGGEIAFTTDTGLYYYEDSDKELLRRYGLRTGSFIAAGAYADFVEIDEVVYVLSRNENDKGEIDNLFTLTSYDGNTYEIRDLVIFENIGDDRLEYVMDGYVYLSRNDGTVYRIRLDDSEQNKEGVYAVTPVFIDGKAYYLKGTDLMIDDLANGEIKILKSVKY